MKVRRQHFGHVSGSSTLPISMLRCTIPVMPRRDAPRLTRVTRAFNECFDVLAERFPDFGELELHHDEKAGGDNGHGSDRQFGYCTVDPPFKIAFAAKTEELPDEFIVGLMRHEFGHAIDHRYGARLERMLGTKLPKSVERRADKIAEIVFGDEIRYSSDLLIQCVECDGVRPRPKKLG